MDENVIESLSFFWVFKVNRNTWPPRTLGRGRTKSVTGDVHLLICMTANFELFTRNIGMIA